MAGVELCGLCQPTNISRFMKQDKSLDVYKINKNAVDYENSKEFDNLDNLAYILE